MSKKFFVFAHKTLNIYQDEYNKLTILAITSVYKKIPDKISNKINSDEQKIIEYLRK